LGQQERSQKDCFHPRKSIKILTQFKRILFGLASYEQVRCVNKFDISYNCIVVDRFLSSNQLANVNQNSSYDKRVYYVK
jgi:hypothetical protein